MPAALAKAQAAGEVAHGDSLLDQLQGLQAKALGILARAETAGDLRSALGAIREVRATLELIAKVTGELRDKGRQDGDQLVQVNFVIGRGYDDRLMDLRGPGKWTDSMQPSSTFPAETLSCPRSTPR